MSSLDINLRSTRLVVMEEAVAFAVRTTFMKYHVVRIAERGTRLSNFKMPL